MTVSHCPDAPDLVAFLDGGLDAARAEELGGHVDDCPACQATLDRLTRAASAIRERRQALSSVIECGPGVAPSTPAPDADDPPDTQVFIGRPLLAPHQLVLKPDVPGFRVDEEIGRGGMGVVYQGLHKRLNRPVAIKMVLAGGLADPRVTQRFLFEAEVLARVAHPRVVRVYEVNMYRAPTGVAVPYLAMELLDGGTLHDITKGPRLPFTASAELVAGLARAAHAAHVQGIVHRDIKPANVLRAKDGPFKLADFGLAKLTAGAGDGLTGTGTVVGTPSYMAPEQAKGAPDIGPAADTYSLGAVLYELLTGRPPFAGTGDPMSVLMKVIHQSPLEVRALAPGVPRDLAAVAMKCLAKEPRHRYATAEALADDLDRVVAGRPTQARPVRGTEKAALWCRRNPAVAGLLAALAVTIAGALAGTTALYFQAQREAVAATDAARLAERNERSAIGERAQADRANAYLEFEQGANWCEQGRPDQGMRLFLSALERAERQKEGELARVIRVNVRNWADTLFPPGRRIDLPGECTAATYSPDGKLIALAGRSGARVRLVGADTGELVANLEPEHKYLIYDMGLVAQAWMNHATAPNWVAVQKIYAAVDRCIDHFLGLTCRSVAFDSAGEWVAVGNDEGRVTAWKWRTGESRRLVLPGRPNVWAVAATKGGGFWLGTEDGVIRWNPATGKRESSRAIAGRAVSGLTLAKQTITKILTSADGKFLFTGDRHGQVIQWDAEGLKPVAAWQVEGWVVDLTHAPLSPAPHLFALTNMGTASVIVAPPAAGQKGEVKLLTTLQQARGQAFALSLDSRVLVLGDGDGNVTLWDTFTGRPSATPLHVPGLLRGVQFRPGSREFMLVSGDGARVQELPWPPAVPLAMPQLAVNVLAVRRGPPGTVPAPGGQVLVAASAYIALFDARSGDHLAGARAPHTVTAALFHPTRDAAMIGYRSGWVLFDFATKRPAAVHSLPDYLGARSFAVRPGSGELYVNTGTHIRVFAPSGEGATVRRLEFDHFRPGEEARDTLFTPNGSTLVVARGDTVDFLDPLTGMPRHPPIVTADEILAAAMSADGRLLATGHRDNTAEVWGRGDRQARAGPTAQPHPRGDLGRAQPRRPHRPHRLPRRHRPGVGRGHAAPPRPDPPPPQPRYRRLLGRDARPLPHRRLRRRGVRLARRHPPCRGHRRRTPRQVRRTDQQLARGREIGTASGRLGRQEIAPDSGLARPNKGQY